MDLPLQFKVIFILVVSTLPARDYQSCQTIVFYLQIRSGLAEEYEGKKSGREAWWRTYVRVSYYNINTNGVVENLMSFQVHLSFIHGFFVE